MRRIIIAAMLLIGFTFSYAQEEGAPTLNYNVLGKKLKKSDEAIVDEKAKVKASTWFSRGELLQDVHQVNIENLELNMMVSVIQHYMKQPTEVRTSEEGGAQVEEHVYERIVLKYVNGQLRDWEETQVLHEAPLRAALDAYKEALKLDEKGKLGKKVKDNLENMKLQAETDGIRKFSNKKFEGAVEDFELILDISKVDLFEGYIDTLIIYNAALAARNAGDHDKAAKYFEKATEINYGGPVSYYLLKTEYVELKDSLKALGALERAYAIYPDSTLIIFELINYHLSAGNSEEGMKYLTAAENLAGDNPSIYFAKGTLFEKLGDKDKALQAYEDALKVDPEFFNAWFNIGALYFNNAVEMYEAANTIEDLDEYNKAKEAADVELAKAVEPLEKSHELVPDDKAALETLSTIYYRLQMMDKRDEVQEKLKNL